MCRCVEMSVYHVCSLECALCVCVRACTQWVHAVCVGACTQWVHAVCVSQCLIIKISQGALFLVPLILI